MLLRKARGNPDDGDGFETRGVSEELAQMVVIGALKLILDKHPPVGADVLAQDVGAKWAHRSFLSLHFEVHVESVRQFGNVLRPCEPRGEIRRLAGPDFAKIN